MSASLTPFTPIQRESERRKTQKELFSGLNVLTTTADVRATRSARRRALLEQAGKLQSGRQFGARTVGIVFGDLMGKAFRKLFSPEDAQIDRAAMVEDAMAAAEKQTGEVLPAQIKEQAVQQATEQSRQEAQQAAQKKPNVEQAPSLLDQQHLLIANTMRELTARGLAADAALLAPNLKNIEDARVAEAKAIAELDQAEFNLADSRDGESINILPRGASEPLLAQIFSNGKAWYIDPTTDEEVILSPGEYIKSNIVGALSTFQNKEAKLALGQERGMINTLDLLTRLSVEIENNPEALTVAGDAFAFMNNFVGDLNLFKRQNWANNRAQLVENQEEWQTWLTENNIANAQQRISIEKLAFALASARENGKLSVSDIEFAANAFGAGRRDPSVRLSLMDDVVLDMLAAHKTNGLFDGFSTTNPIWRRANDLFDGYEQVRLKRAAPVRRLGERPEDAPAIPEEDRAEGILFRDSRGTIR